MHTSIKRQIIELAKAQPDREVCGFIYADGHTAKLFPCVNVAENPAEEFQIESLDYIRAEYLGDIFGVYHSHPTPVGFSEADLECAEELALPFYMYDVQADKWNEYIPKSYEPRVECEDFVLGFKDCYGLVKDYFWLSYKKYLSDYDRDESFVHEEQGVIMDSFEKEGFTKVPVDSIQIGDVILFKTDKALPQHFGILIAPQVFLHHPQNGLSRKEMLTGRWLSRIFCALRVKNSGNSV